MSRKTALQLRTMIGGAWTTQALGVAASLKVADLVDGETHIDQLGKKTGTRPELLFRVLRGLASQGVFEEMKSGVFRNTELSELLKSDVPNSLRSVAVFFADQTYHAFEHFEDQLRTGDVSFDKKYGGDFFAVNKSDPDRTEVFNRAMAEISYEQAGAVLDAYDFSKLDTLGDVGGGNGDLLAAILKKTPNLKGTLFEQPHVVDEAKSNLKGSEIEDRIEYKSGNFFEPIDLKVDAILMKYIIHDWPDDKAKLILENCKHATSKLLVVEQMIPPGNDPLYGKMSDLMMMVNFGSGERTQADFERVFHSAGWKIQKIHPTDYLLYVIELERV